MKKITVLIMFCCFMAFLLVGDENQEEPGSIKDFYRWDTTEPVLEKMKPGFDSLTSGDIENYLEFLASDLLEGRDTASQTYNIAAEYAASLFRLWNLQPAGDFPAAKIRRYFNRGKKKTNTSPRRTFLQEIVMKELLDFDHAITVHYRKGSLNQSRTFYPDVDYMKPYSSISSGRTEEINVPVVFVGYGISEKSINFDEYQGIDVKGKVLLMFSGIPQDDKDDSPFKKGTLKEKYYPSEEQLRRQWWRNPQLELARKKGALAVLTVGALKQDPAYTKRILKYQIDKTRLISSSRYLSLFEGSPLFLEEEIPNITIPAEMAGFIFGTSGGSQDLERLRDQIDKKLTPQSRELPGISINIKNESKTRLVKCRNVLGFIEGSDPVLKKEVIVIGAHLDHIGKKGDNIYNGANDDGSGSAAVLELAQAFALNPVKPKRSLLFALWTGEERNIVGSQYYVHAPFFPLEKTTAYLNLDMIGWEWESLEKLTQRQEMIGTNIPGEILKKIDDVTNFLAIPLSERTTKLYDALKNSGRYVGMSLFLENKVDDITPGDCTPFFMKGVPCVEFYTSNNEKYHKPEDDIDLINFDLVEKVSRLVYVTAFQLADQ